MQWLYFIKIYLTIAFSQETFSDLVSDKAEDNNSVVKIKDLILSGCSLKLAISPPCYIMGVLPRQGRTMGQDRPKCKETLSHSEYY